jgi:hypothetical protein
MNYCQLFSPDGSGIPRFFSGEYSGQQESIFPDKSYSFAANNFYLWLLLWKKGGSK